MQGRMGAVISLAAMLLFLTLSGGGVDSSPSTRGAGMMVSVISPQLNDQISGVFDFVIYAESEGQVVNYVSLQISEDNITWKLVDFTEDTDPQHRYTIGFNSTRYKDGDYYFKIRVKDDSGNSTELVTGQLEVWNPDPPVISWSYPKYGDVIREEVEVIVRCGDHDGDLIDGLHLFIAPLGGSDTFLDAVYYPDADNRYRYVLNTWDFPDGEYFLTANATTTYDLTASGESASFFIDNEYAPVVKMAPITDPDSLTGTVLLSASLSDLDDNVNSRGVEFFYSGDGSDAKVKIGNDPDPNNDYTVEWNTEEVKNGNYTIYAEAWDEGEPRQKGQDQMDVRIVNLPEALTLENVGRMEDGWHVRLTMKRIPLAYPVDIGVFISFNVDYIPWSYITLDKPMDIVRPNVFEIPIPVNQLPEGNISVRIELSDRYGLGDTIEAGDLFYFIPMIPPEVTLQQPEEEYLSGTVWIWAEVIDDEDPLVNPVYFHYSHDNSTWTQIGMGAFSYGRLYKVAWDTSDLADHDHYHIRANYTDSTGIPAESFLKDISTMNEGAEPPGEEDEPLKWYEKPKNLMIGGVIAVIIGIIAAVFLVALRTAGKRIRKKRESGDRKRQEEDRRKKLDKDRRMRDREMDDLIRHKSMRDISGGSRPGSKPDGGVPLKPGERRMGGDQIRTDKAAPLLEDMEVKADIGITAAPVQMIREEEPGAEMIRPSPGGSPKLKPAPIVTEPAAKDGYHIDCRCGRSIWIPAGNGYFNFKCDSCGRAGRVLR